MSGGTLQSFPLCGAGLAFCAGIKAFLDILQRMPILSVGSIFSTEGRHA